MIRVPTMRWCRRNGGARFFEIIRMAGPTFFAQFNYLAVLASALAIFAIGGIWYSNALFSKRWVVLMGKSEEEMKAAAASSPMPLLLLGAFVCGALISFAMAVVINHLPPFTALRGIEIGAFC